MKSDVYAVLTGDIVRSGKLKSEDLAAIQDRLKSIVPNLQVLSENAVIGRLGITRGDGWQLALSRPDRALRSALYVRASLKAEFSIDTRVCIGVGGVERLVKDAIVESTGPAFELSGRGLDELPKMVRMDLEMEESSASLRQLVRLMDAVVQRWSGPEALAVAGTLMGRTQEEIAAGSPPNPKTGKAVTRQAISDALIRAHWEVVSQCTDFVEKALCKL